MTTTQFKTFCEEFPPLWEDFKRAFKNRYMQLNLTAADPTAHTLGRLYSEVGDWTFLFEDNSLMHRLREIFFDKKYSPLIDKFNSYDTLDSILAKRVQKRRVIFSLLFPGFPTTEASRERFFRLMVKPLLDDRKQELLDGLRQLEQELAQPVPYSLELPLDTRTQKYSLAFRSSRKKYSRGSDLQGYTYSFNGRTYRDVESLWAETLEDLSKSVSIGKDAYGERVLKISHGIPTFDSSDREWDSEILENLMFDGKDVNLVIMRGGYKIAELTFYETLLAADSSLKPLFEKLGWPTGAINWTRV